MNRTDDAYEEMKRRDRDAWRPAPSRAEVAAAHDAAREAVNNARQHLEARFGTCDQMSLGEQAERTAAKNLPNIEQQKASVQVAKAAEHVAAKTDALMKLLEVNANALLEIERAQAELAVAQEELRVAEERRNDVQSDVAAVRTKHVVTDYERGLQAGRDYLAGLRAGGK